MDTDIIVPVYNEEKNVKMFYDRVKTAAPECGIVFIDNASCDNTREVIKSLPDAHLIAHDRNKGYGASIRDGILNTRAENIIILDADCEYPPEEIPNMLKQLSETDIVYASRFLNGISSVRGVKAFGNKVITAMFNLLFGQHITDLYTGCKALKRSVISSIDLQRNGFEQVLEMSVKLSCKGHKIVEIPIKFEPRISGKSKMKHFQETLKFLWLIVYYKISLRKE